MMKWCLLLVFMSVLENAHQFPSTNKEICRVPSREKVVNETSFHLCESILGQIIDRFKHKGDIYELLQETGVRANFWMFGKEISGSNHCCNNESKESHLVHFSWNSGQNDCVNLEIFNDNGTPNFTEYICDLNSNFSEGQREFANLKLNTVTIIERNTKTKRSLTRKVIHSYVNLAREIESTECSSPTLNVYFNKKLVFSNASGVVSNDVSMDSIEVHINVDTSRFYNSIPGKSGKGYILNKNPMSMYEALADCRNQGKKLLDLESKEETNEVVAAMGESQIREYWTSGHRLGINRWHWHGAGVTMDYMNWGSHQPNHNDRDDYCIKIKQHEGTWSDEACGSKLPFICEGTVVTEAVKIPPIVNIFVDGNLTYEYLPAHEHNQDQSNVIEVKIGVNGGVVEDHSTKFLLLQKNTPQEEASEQRLVTPSNFVDSEFNGIDIRIENIKQKGFRCEKEKFYHFHTEKKLNYMDAQKFCQNRSMQLVSIQNEKQHLDIESIMLKLNIDHYYWTSGYLAADGATWLWNENEAVTYSNWAKGEPNNRRGNEKCMEIYVPWKTAKWNDQDCHDKNRIICESFTEPYWRREND